MAADVLVEAVILATKFSRKIGGYNIVLAWAPKVAQEPPDGIFTSGCRAYLLDYLPLFFKMQMLGPTIWEMEGVR